MRYHVTGIVLVIPGAVSGTIDFAIPGHTTSPKLLEYRDVGATQHFLYKRLKVPLTGNEEVTVLFDLTLSGVDPQTIPLHFILRAGKPNHAGFFGTRSGSLIQRASSAEDQGRIRSYRLPGVSISA